MMSDPVEILLVSDPDAEGGVTIEWSGTDQAEALRVQAEHPEWMPWHIDPTRDPATREGWPA